MCGIFGYSIGTGGIKNPLQFRSFVNVAFSRLEHRGYDAMGIMAKGYNGEFEYRKSGCRSSNWLKRNRKSPMLNVELWKNWVGHTRWSTGSPSHNLDNIHPFVGEKHAIVHNGACVDHLKIVERNDFTLKGETDSEIILNFQEKFGMINGTKKLFENVFGRFAITSMHKEKGTMLVARNSMSPMTMMKIPYFNAIVFCSEIGYIITALTLSIGKGKVFKKVAKNEHILHSLLPYHVFIINNGTVTMIENIELNTNDATSHTLADGRTFYSRNNMSLFYDFNSGEWLESSKKDLRQIYLDGIFDKKYTYLDRKGNLHRLLKW